MDVGREDNQQGDTAVTQETQAKWLALMSLSDKALRADNILAATVYLSEAQKLTEATGNAIRTG